MNEAFEKILERLDEASVLRANSKEYFNNPQNGEYVDDVVLMKDAIKIVNEVASEYNDGWIPCSERLPEIDGNTSDTVLVCGSNGFQYMAFWCDDLKWRFCECGMAKEPVLWTEIVAWQPLPEPYKEGN